MHIEIKKIVETQVTMIRLTHEGKTYTTGCLFQDEAGEKIQLLINEALKPKEDDTIR